MYPHNFDDAGSYYSDRSAILASEGLPNGYPSMIPPPAVNQFESQRGTHNASTDHRGMMVPQHYPVVGGPLGFQPVAGATSYANGAHGYNQPSLQNHRWPAVNQQPQPQLQHASFLDWNTLAASNVVMPEASTSLPAPSTVPFHYWGNNQNGPIVAAATAFNLDAYILNQSGPSRTVQPSSSRRFQPYGTSRARRVTEHQNAEAGPSILVPPRAQNVGLPTSEPSGGSIPETTADAEETQTTTEEVGAPVQEKVRCPRGEGKLRPGRIGLQDDKGKLCGLVKRWKSLKAEPSTVVALEATLEYIPTVRAEVYPEPQLETGKTQLRPEGGRKLTEWLRRRQERGLLGRLSQFYELPGNDEPSEERRRRGEKKKKGWMALPLLREILEDMEVRYPPPEPSAPQPSTSTTVDS